MRKLLLAITLLSFASPAIAQEGIAIFPGAVLRATQVHRKPSRRQPVIRSLPANSTVRVLSPEPRRGFWRVILQGGRQGYVSANDVTISTSGLETAPHASRPPCALRLSECEPHGCAEPDDKRGLFNKAKNHVPEGTRSITLSFPDFRSLQRQADTVVEQGTELSQEQRASLRSFRVTNGRAGEGKLVKLTGFIVRDSDPHANTGESVNCRLPTQANNDFHISLARQASQTEFQGIVIEMIPHDRPDTWSLPKLRKVKRDGLLVMVVGGLFYDNDHVVNADATDDLSGQPKRFSLWEIHPITKFFVCRRAGNSCNPGTLSHWTKLEDF